jgi:hypothetical protein
VVLACLLSSILPLIVVAHYPLVDYPNHLGRFQIYQSLHTSPALQTFWQWNWAIIPNLALDLLVIPFTWFMPVEPATNLVTLLALALLCIGTILLDRQLHGTRWGLSLFAGILLYNGAFRMGFINFIAAVAFALVAFAAWTRWRERVVGPGFLGFVVTAVMLLVFHLYAFGLYAVAVAGYEVTVLWETWHEDQPGIVRALRVAACGAASLILPLALLLFSPTSSDAGVLRWSTPLWKLEALLSPVYFNMPLVELPLALLLGALLLAGLVTGGVRIHQRMVVMLGLMALLFLVLPRTLFGSNYADYRLLSGVGFFFLASLELEMPASPRRRVVLLVLCTCLAVRVGSILANWLPAQPILAEYDHALAASPSGARILVLQGSLGSTSADRSPPLEHVPVFAAAKQQDFVPYTFHAAAVPLHLQSAYASYAGAFAPYPENARDMALYDYVLVLRNPQFVIPLGFVLTPVTQGRSFMLYKIEKF